MPEGPSIVILKELVQPYRGADVMNDKWEVLFRIRVHPESKVGALPSRKLGEMIKEARNYSFDKDPTSWKGEETGFFL